MSSQQHTYHLVDPSPWPLLSSWTLFYVALGGASILHLYINGVYLFQLAILTIILLLSFWWRDIIREGTFTFHHTFIVQQSLRFGMILFIVSEVLFFFAFFWAFFHSSLAPTINIGCVWPPAEITVFSPYQIPLLNTCLLLTSGATITLAHYGLLNKDRDTTVKGFVATIVFAVLFTALQMYEYFEAPFSIDSGIYGSTFYLATGFHGLHVIIGTIFITVGFFRYSRDHFTISNHFGFEAAAWYWHFVDVVWIFLYISIYYWGNWA